jgi:hypothetical protein
VDEADHGLASILVYRQASEAAVQLHQVQAPRSLPIPAALHDAMHLPLGVLQSDNAFRNDAVMEA